MLLFLKLSLAIALLLIVIQDFKHQLVWWFLFPIVALCGGWLFKNSVSWSDFGIQVSVNLSLILVIIGVLFLYSKWKLKRNFLNDTFGAGDLLFFLAFALCFPTLIFLNFFVFSLLFSMIISLFLRFRFGRVSIPLAGAMALFLLGVYLSSWLGWSPGLYQL